MKKTNSILFSLFISLSITIGLLSTLSTASASSQSIKKSDKFSNHSLSATTPLTANEPFELLGQLGGLINHVEVSGTYAYVNIDRRLAVLDVSNPAAVSLVDQSNEFETAISDIEFDSLNQRLLVSTKEGVYFYDLANPTQPQEIGLYPQINQGGQIELTGNYAFFTFDSIGSNESTLQIVDISNPSAATLAATRVGGRSTAVENDFAYISRSDPHAGFAEISIVDISDPQVPSEVATISNVAGDLLIDNSTLFIYNSGILAIYDVSDPAHPELISSSNLLAKSGVTTSFLDRQGDLLFIAASAYNIETLQVDHWLRAINIADLAKPVILGTLPLSGQVGGLNVSNDYAYVADGALEVVLVSNPNTPIIVSSYDPHGNDIAKTNLIEVQNGYVYLAGEKLLIIDATTPTAPNVSSTYAPVGNITSLVISGTKAYLNLVNQAGEKWLRILDISDPEHPARLGSLPGNGANDSQIVGNLLYVGNEKGLDIINVSNPLTPTLVNSVETSYVVGHLAVIGDYAYLALANNMAEVVNLKSQMISSSWVVSASDFSQQDNRLFVRTFEPQGIHRIKAYDTSTQAQPTEIASYCSASLGKLVADGDYLFVQNLGTIEAFKLSEPSLQLPIASYGSIGDFSVNNNLIATIRGPIIQTVAWKPPTTTLVAPQQSDIPVWNGYAPMVNDEAFVDTEIKPNATTPLTLTWYMQEQPVITRTIDTPQDVCARSILTRLYPLHWNSAGPKAITLTVENLAGSLTTTHTLYVNNYRPFTVTPDYGGQLRECDLLYYGENGDCFVKVLEVPAGAVTDTTTIQYTPFYTIPHPFDPSVADEPNAQQLEPLPYQVFEIDALQDGVTIADLTFSQPVTVPRKSDYSWIIAERYYEDRLKLRRWDGEKWVHDSGVVLFEVGQCRLCEYKLRFVLHQSGLYALFGEVRQVNSHSYLPLITRN